MIHSLGCPPRARAPRAWERGGARLCAFAFAIAFAVLIGSGPSACRPRATPARRAWTADEVARQSQVSCGIVPGVRRSSPEAEGIGDECPDPMEFARGDGVELSRGLPPIAGGTPLPTDWDLKALLASACGYACVLRAPATAQLLAWSVIEDDRPLRNLNALVLVDTHARGAERRWVLVQMYRHATNRWWNIDRSNHSGSKPIAPFDRPPDNTAILGLLERNQWLWQDERYNNGARWVDGFRIRAGNVLDEVWRQALGRSPARLFPPSVEFRGM
jgi:hypothetical protein